MDHDAPGAADAPSLPMPQVSAGTAGQLGAIVNDAGIAILAQLGEGVIVTDAAGRITFVNQAAYRIHGVAKLDVEPGDYTAAYSLLTVDGEPYPPHELPLARAVGGAIVEDACWRVRRPDGSMVFVRGSARPLLDAGGVQIGAVLSLRDGTQREAAEQEVRENEVRLRTLTDNLPGGMVYQLSASRDGTDRRFTYVSQSYERLTGIPAQDVLADASIPSRLIVEEDRPRVEAAEAAAIAGPTLFDVVVRIRRADGALRWTRIISAPRPQPDGTTIWDGMQIDVTEQEEAEAALRESQAALSRLNETLEARVLQRTDELEAVHEQLRHSQKLEAMGQLTGGVAHDFNNLLTPIVGSLDMLQRRQLGDAREQRLIAGALESAERAKTLVQRLLAFARRQPLQSSAVDIGRLIAGMAELVASTAGPGIALAIDVADDLPPARSDPNQLEMAILNLAVNARDAMPDGGTLTLAAALVQVGAGHRSGLPDGDYVQLVVADTGTGMDAATLAKAVEPFFSTKGIGKGTGLGLSMVHGLASQLDGAMLIASEPGAGTRVELLLPVADERAAAGAVARPERAVPGAGSVLLVDDEDLVRDSTAEMLRELGYRVSEAGSAREALGRLAEAGFDYVVTDHLMPGMSGTDLARVIARDHPGTAVLVISGYTQLEGIAPDIPRLAKPFRQDELARSLAGLLG